MLIWILTFSRYETIKKFPKPIRIFVEAVPLYTTIFGTPTQPKDYLEKVISASNSKPLIN